MKNLLSSFFCALIFTGAFGKTTFVAEQHLGMNCIMHNAKQGEILNDIAAYYYLDAGLLGNLNSLNSGDRLKEKQMLLIPLTETNFFKTLGLNGTQNGFYPVYYNIKNDEDLVSICNQFHLAIGVFKKWNESILTDSKLEGKKAMVGWLKCKLVSNDSKQLAANVGKEPLNATKEVILEPKQAKVQNTATQIQSRKDVMVKPSPKTVTNTSTKESSLKKESSIHRLTRKLKDAFTQKPPVVKEKANIEDASVKSLNSKGENKISLEPNEADTKPSTKKTFRIWWSNLVNGKKYTEANEANRAVVNKEKLEIKKTTSVKKPIEKPLVNSIKPSTKVNTNAAVNSKTANAVEKKAIASNKTLPEKLPVPSVKKLETSSVKVDKPIPGTDNVTPINREIKKKAEVLKEEKRSLSEQKLNSSTEAKLPVSEPMAVKKDEVIHNEVKKLSLSNMKLGKCAYFFAGPSTGQFYVFTNLAAKGEIVKVTNQQNGKFIYAEVIGALPNADLSKGLMIKLSDNAKLPLGQKSNLFGVKINYE